MQLQRELDSISGRLADIEGDATTNGVSIPKLKSGAYDFSVLPRAATSTASKDALAKFIEDSRCALAPAAAKVRHSDTCAARAWSRSPPPSSSCAPTSATRST